MKTVLSIDKAKVNTIRYFFYNGTKCFILADYKVMIYNTQEKTSVIYNISKHYDEICYCSKKNCYYAVAFNENLIYKLDQDFKVIFSILVKDLTLPLKDINYDYNSDTILITDDAGIVKILPSKIERVNNDDRIISCICNNTFTCYLTKDALRYYLILGSMKYRLPLYYIYTAIICCETIPQSSEYKIIIAAENSTSILLLELNTAELLHHESYLLLNIAEEEKAIAYDLNCLASQAEDSIKFSSNINDLIAVNTKMQTIIDEIIIEEYLLYRKAHKIIKGT